MTKRQGILAKIRFVPSLPAMVGQLREMLQDPDVDFGELAGAIEYDPGLTANILRLANSSQFGYFRSIESVRSAVLRLGMRRVYQMVVGLSAGPLVRSAFKGYDLPAGDLWRHSVAVAVAAQQLGQVLEIELPEHTFTSGLLHDVGKVVMSTFVQVDAGPILDLAFEKHVPFDAAERDVLGIDHAEVAGVLLEKWHLPPDIVEAARWHHEPLNCTGDRLVTDLVHVADALCLSAGLGAGSDGLNYRPCPEAVGRLGLSTASMEAVVCRTIAGLAELQELLEDDTGRQ